MAILLGVAVAVVCFSVYGAQFLLYHQTKISDEEIFISRIGTIPFTNTEYTINLDTDDEKIAIYSLFGQAWFIAWGGECRCITMVHKIDSYSVSLMSEKGEVYYSTGKTVFKTVPYEQERHKFEVGLTIRNTFKKRYADILSP